MLTIFSNNRVFEFFRTIGPYRYSNRVDIRISFDPVKYVVKTLNIARVSYYGSRMMAIPTHGTVAQRFAKGAIPLMFCTCVQIFVFNIDEGAKSLFEVLGFLKRTLFIRRFLRGLLGHEYDINVALPAVHLW